MISMTINGKPAETRDRFDVVNPATGAVEAQAPECTPEQLDEAMASAANAFEMWKRSDDETRREVLRNIATAIEQNKSELDRLLVLESGKPAMLASAEHEGAPPWWHYYADMDIPRTVLQDDEAALVELAHRPLGVVAAITPWNGPIGLASWKIAPALRAGNTVVIKPSPFTPLSTLYLGQILADVVPPGVVNVVTGGDRLGAAMVSHRTPRKISFTGSTEAGRHIATAAASDFKRVTLELGGNDAAILLDDVDIEATVAALKTVALMNCGQICAIPKRIFVPQKIYGAVVDAFAAAYNAVITGDPNDPATEMGPLSTRPQYERVGQLVQDAVHDGARIVAGGGPVGDGGFFFRPTVLADVAEGVRVVDEEQFGPVTPILSYDSVDEALARANATTFGLCGSVWSADADRAGALAEQLECGTSFINTHAVLPPHIPFSGAKWSGLGVENGVAGLISFTESQVVHRARA